jgi:hypothetical protein
MLTHFLSIMNNVPPTILPPFFTGPTLEVNSAGIHIGPPLALGIIMGIPFFVFLGVGTFICKGVFLP